MKKIVLFDPSYGTSNLGDFIINEAVMREMDFFFDRHYLVRYSTHNPLMHLHQLLRKHYISWNCAPENLKFLGGSNIFKHNLLRYILDWNVNIFTKTLYQNSVSVGAGVEGDPKTVNRYTRNIYKKILSSGYVHSARDEPTKIFIESLGFKAVNTGCPTTWALTKDHCKMIPREKSSSVVFTLTSNKGDQDADQQLIDVLVKNYDKVYFWMQGAEDDRYLARFSNIDTVRSINPNLESYRKLLKQGDIDFVGTRLHAGIFAMQHKVRAIIVVVDNRARDMQKSYNVNAIERTDLGRLDSLINSNFPTEVSIDLEKVAEWKSQFNNY